MRHRLVGDFRAYPQPTHACSRKGGIKGKPKASTLELPWRIPAADAALAKLPGHLRYLWRHIAGRPAEFFGQEVGHVPDNKHVFTIRTLLPSEEGQGPVTRRSRRMDRRPAGFKI
jgi:hypothetical protein